MKDQIQLADILKTTIQCLDKNLNEVEDAQLALGIVDAKDEKKGCIVAIDDTDVGAQKRSTLDKVAQGVGTVRNNGKNFAHQLLLTVLGEIIVDLDETWLAVVVEDDDRLDHGFF